MPKPETAQRPGPARARLLPLLQPMAGPAAALVIILAVLGEAIPTYTAYSIGLASVYGMAVLSVSLLAGWGGVWSTGHPALLAIGAYIAAYGAEQGWYLEVILVLAAGGCALCGAFLGFAGSRFTVLYIALLTLAFCLVVLEIIGSWTSVTGGDQGIPVFSVPTLMGDMFAGGTEAAALAVGAFGLALAAAVVIRGTALRMRLVAAKNQPLVSRTLGISPVAQTSLAFTVSGAVTGIAGVCLALISGFVSPATFSLVLAINIIAAAVLGGTGSILGAVVGGAFLTWSPSLAQATSIDQPYLIGGLLIVVLIFFPAGLAPSLVSLVKRALPRRPEPLPVSSAHLADEAADPAGDKPAPAASAASGGEVLRVDDLGVRYGGLHAIEEVTMRVAEGEVLAIIGPNGAGKTTLVNALSGLTPGGKVTGVVTLSGTALNAVPATRRRSHGLSRTFQHAELFDELTIVENLLVTGRRAGAAQRRDAVRMLREVGLEAAADRYPAELSFGLQKRADLARALSESSRLLVLDEPFGGLDADERHILARFIGRQRDRGISIVIIDHVLEDLFKVADRAVAFDFGKLIAEGKPEGVLADDRVRTSYLGSQSSHAAPPVLVPESETLVSLKRVSFQYPGVQALTEVDIEVKAGSILGVVGANGAGKSTLGRLLHGLTSPASGQRTLGTVDGRAPRISLVPEGRALFKTLSVIENLEVAGYGAGFTGRNLQERIDTGLQWLPRQLRARGTVSAGALSGGEQQLVAIARALVAAPDILILDEPALGLSPAMVDEVYGKIGDLAHHGMTTVLLEQLLSRALRASSQTVVLRGGRVVAVGDATMPGFGTRAEAEYFGEQPSTPAAALGVEA